MLELSAKIRDENKTTNALRNEGIVPGVIYGYEMDNLSIQVDAVDFDKVYREAGESTLIKINLTDQDGKKVKETPTVLIQETQEHAVTDEFTHVDFYQPNLKEKVEVEIPLEFVGQSLAVKDEDGTLVRNLSEVTIEALPENLIHGIEVDISVLETFDDVIKVKDLEVPEGVEIMEEEEEVVALVSRPQDIEEELEEPLEDDLEGVEVIGEEEEGEEEAEAAEAEEVVEDSSKEEK
ncbi:MAG: 50S ribosomal protein L25 [Patescibacteria group bacterium]